MKSVYPFVYYIKREIKLCGKSIGVETQCHNTGSRYELGKTEINLNLFKQT